MQVKFLQVSTFVMVKRVQLDRQDQQGQRGQQGQQVPQEQPD
jgi:hypothetical protein